MSNLLAMSNKMLKSTSVSLSMAFMKRSTLEKVNPISSVLIVRVET